LEANSAVEEPGLVFFCIGRDRDQEPKKQQKGQ